MKKKDQYKEHACEFRNEDECEEDMDEDGLDINEAEKDHYEEDEDSYQ